MATVNNWFSLQIARIRTDKKVVTDNDFHGALDKALIYAGTTEDKKWESDVPMFLHGRQYVIILRKKPPILRNGVELSPTKD